VVTGTVVVSVVPGAVVVSVVVTGAVTVVFPAEVRQTPPVIHDVCGVACALASTSIGPTITADNAAQPPRIPRSCLLRGISVIPLAFLELGMPDFCQAEYDFSCLETFTSYQVNRILTESILVTHECRYINRPSLEEIFAEHSADAV
jgi:hypothetical protein